jgi:hypothetical protein
MFAQVAKKAGLGVTDNEVLVGMRSNPPAVLASSPSFQTNGQFDMSKYQQALANPGNNWAPFEEMLREQLPVRKLQERLMSSLKLTQPELKQAFRERYDRVSATLLTVPAADSGAHHPQALRPRRDQGRARHGPEPLRPRAAG